LTNHFKDEEDDFEQTKLLCRFLNPQAAASIWDKKDTVETISTKDTMFDTMAVDLKGKYTPEELQSMMDDPKHYEGLDRIEKA
jgi:hypothetical protein